MGTIAGTAAVIGLVLGAVGSGVSYYSSSQAAKANDAMAMANAMAQTQSAKNQGNMAAAQAQLEAIKSGAARDAALANAAGIRAQTEAESRAAQENIRRTRIDFATMMARQRAATASKGVVDTTGSPLDLLVKGSEDEALLESEMRYSDEIARRQGFRSADLEEVQAKVAGLDIGMALLSGAAAQNRAGMAASQAKIDLFGERAKSSAMRTNALGSAISSAGSIGRDYYDYRRYASKTPAVV